MQQKKTGIVPVSFSISGRPREGWTVGQGKEDERTDSVCDVGSSGLNMPHASTSRRERGSSGRLRQAEEQGDGEPRVQMRALEGTNCSKLACSDRS